jgi:hypothetical protein
MHHPEPLFDGLVAGEAKPLHFVLEQALLPAVVSDVAGEAFPCTLETMGGALILLSLALFVADHAEGASPRGVQDVCIGSAMVLVAPLAAPISQGLVGRG